MNEDQLRTALNRELAGFFGKLHQRIDVVEAKLDGKADRLQIDQLQTSLDGIAKRLDTDEQERSAISSHQERQDGWIGQLAHATKTKLVPEQ